MIGPFGYAALALGTSLAAVFNAVYLLWAIRRVFAESGSPFSLSPLARSFGANLGIALLMGGACLWSWYPLNAWLPDYVLGRSMGAGLAVARAVKVLILVAEGAALMLILARIFKIREATDAFDFFTEKLKKKLSRSTK